MYNRSERHYGQIPDTNDRLHEDGFYGDPTAGEPKEALEVRVARYASFATLGIFTLAIFDRLYPKVMRKKTRRSKR